MGGYHRPVCVETVVGPLHHYSVGGGADNNNNNRYLMSSAVQEWCIASCVRYFFVARRHSHVASPSFLSLFLSAGEFRTWSI